MAPTKVIASEISSNLVLVKFIALCAEIQSTMDVKGSTFYSDWPLLRTVKNLLLYFIPRFFVVDTKCFASSTVMPNKKLYNICENMVNYETQETMCEPNQLSRLMNGLTGVKNLNSPQKARNFSDQFVCINSNMCEAKHTEFGLYDKIIEIEDKLNFCRPEMKFLFQINCEVQITEEKSVPKATSSSTGHVKCTDSGHVSSSLDSNANSKVCDNKELKRNRRLNSKGRACIKREKKRTRCNNRRSRKPIAAVNKVADASDNVFKVEEEVKVDKTVTQNDIVPKSDSSNLLQVQFDGVVEWSFVNDENETDLSLVDRCGSVAYIIDTSDSLSFCLDDEGDDDWDCVDDVGSDNDDLWESFQPTGLFLGNFVCNGGDTVDGNSSFEECEDDVNARIRLADVNKRWETGLQTFLDICSKKKNLQKVHFAANIVEVHVLTLSDDEDTRKGPWEEYARDRERFTRRIEDLSQIISPILCKVHREKMYKRIYG